MIYYQCRIRNAADSADDLVLTSVSTGTNPYISEAPTGDGQGFDPRTGRTEIGAYAILVADNGSGAAAVTGALADASGRYDKLGRRAYLAYGTNGTTYPNLLVAGYVTQISFPSAAEAQITIGEAQRSGDTKMAFSAASTTFPATTMLGGGPLRTNVQYIAARVPNNGPWQMKVYVAPSAVYYVPLRFVSGFVWADEAALVQTLATDSRMPTYAWRRLNAQCSTEPIGRPGLDGVYSRYQMQNVYVDVYTTSGTFVGTFPVYRTTARLTSGSFDDVSVNAPQMVIDEDYAIYADFTGVATPTVGTVYNVYLYSRTISEANPLHVFMHPVDVITGLLDDAGDLWETTSAAAVKAEIGADARVFLRITESVTTSEFVNKLLGLYGLGRRMNSSNQWVLFSQRAKGAAPATTLTLADLREIPKDVWTLDQQSIVNTVVVSQLRFALWYPGAGGTRPSDNLIANTQTVTAEYQKSDGSYAKASQGVRSISHELPGTIVSVLSGELDLQQFTSALASPTFDRWGHGAPESTLICRDTVSLQPGDEFIANMNFLPNGNVRGGNRIVQVIRRTNEPGGPVLVVEDGGLAAQPSVAPTFTIAANTGTPLAAADVTLTNAAALVAAGVASVLVEWIVSVGAPAVAGQDLGAIIPVTPLVLTTPPVAAGSVVWARAKSVQPGRRPSAWTAWSSVTLGSVGAPGSLTATPSGTDASRCALSWTAGSNSAAFLMDVLVRPTGGTIDTPALQLLAGSLAATLSGLTASTAYTATVRYLDANSGIVVASSTVAFTSGATVLTLPAPTSPQGFSGSIDPSGRQVQDGSYGIQVTAADIPGTVEVFEAVETSVGSGTYGTSVSVGSVGSVLGGPTTLRRIAPNDRLRRQLKARHIRQGTTSSSFTSVVTVTPWTSNSGGIGVAPSFASLSYGGSPDYALNTIDIGWVSANAPAGATYNLTVYEQTNATHPERGNTYEFVGVSSVYTYACINDIDAAGVLTKLFKAYVSMIVGSTVVAVSSTVALTLNSNT